MGIREKKKKESVLMQSCATGDSLRQLGLERQFECKRKPLRKKQKNPNMLCFPVCMCVYICLCNLCITVGQRMLLFWCLFCVCEKEIKFVWEIEEEKLKEWKRWRWTDIEKGEELER